MQILGPSIPTVTLFNYEQPFKGKSEGQKKYKAKYVLLISAYKSLRQGSLYCSTQSCHLFASSQVKIMPIEGLHCMCFGLSIHNRQAWFFEPHSWSGSFKILSSRLLQGAINQSSLHSNVHKDLNITNARIQLWSLHCTSKVNSRQSRLIYGIASGTLPDSCSGDLTFAPGLSFELSWNITSPGWNSRTVPSEVLTYLQVTGLLSIYKGDRYAHLSFLSLLLPASFTSAMKYFGDNVCLTRVCFVSYWTWKMFSIHELELRTQDWWCNGKKPQVVQGIFWSSRIGMSSHRASLWNWMDSAKSRSFNLNRTVQSAMWYQYYAYYQLFL